MLDQTRLVAETLRVYDRYAKEVVETLDICPFAKQARLDRRVEPRVVLCDTPDVSVALAELDAVEEQPQLEICLLIFPLLDLDRPQFQHFGAQVRQADADRKPRGGTIMAMADFHPRAKADMATPERLVPFVRRTPDPTFQLVRRDALERVRKSTNDGTAFVDVSSMRLEDLEPQPTVEPLAQRIARNNLRTIQRLGPAEVERTLRDIEEDRHRSYGQLGLPRPGWAADV